MIADGNVAPAPLIESISTTRVEETQIDVASSASDPAGASDTLTYRYEVFKDGAATAFASDSGVDQSAFSFTPDDNGSYRIVLTVSDEDGGSTTVDQTISVDNVAPIAADQNYTTLEDTPISFKLLTGTDDSGPFAVIDPGTPDTHTAIAGTFATTAGGSVTIAASGGATYTPAVGFAGEDSFSFTVEDDDGGSGTATVTVRNLVDLSGRVFDDLNNDGLFNGSDVALENVTVELFHETDLFTPIAMQTTDADGRYTFDANLGEGQYRIVETQPAMLLDGDETAGGLSGTVDNTQDSDAISNIIVTSGDSDADGYNFADIRPSRIQGLVWEDFNDDGEVNFGEQAIEDVAIALAGIDDRGNAVIEVMNTDSQGIFEFINLRPSDGSGYTLTETQPAGFVDGEEALGTVNGVLSGVVADNVFSQIGMTTPVSDVMDYNYGERPEAGGAVQAGQAATIGFWQNKNGQNLVKSLNGGESSIQLGNWLATTFPNMYGASAGLNDLTGLTNADVAGVFKTLFKRNRKTAAADGPPKLDAQVMATAFAVYVTNETLAASAATNFGFLVTETGIGSSTINIGDNGAAFDVTDNTDVTVLDILLKTDERTRDGLLFDLNNDDTIDDFELTLRVMANLVYTDINEQGDI
ncbi:MAG: SdrD B-like domain-containing protein [Pirellulales bacterium]